MAKLIPFMCSGTVKAREEVPELQELYEGDPAMKRLLDTVEDLEGGGRIRSTNGKLSLARLSGDYDVQTTNGSIQVDDCNGLEKAETTNGAPQPAAAQSQD